MGGNFSDICFRTELCASNENIILDFQHNALSFPTNISSKRRPSVGTVSKSTSNQDRSSSKITSSIAESVKEYMKSGCINSKLHSSDSSLHDAKEENNEARAKKSILPFSTSFSSQVEPEEVECVCINSISKQVLEQNDIPVIVGNNFSCKDGISETPTLERVRSNAIELKPAEAPQGKFVREKRFYIRKSYGDWESVCLESWNSWNATWQVRGGDGISFPAAPIALKSKDEYEFLSRNRVVNCRSFGSLSETSSIKLVELVD